MSCNAVVCGSVLLDWILHVSLGGALLSFYFLSWWYCA